LAVLEYPVFKRFVRDHIPHYITLGDPEQLARMAQFGGLYQLPQGMLEAAVDRTVTVLADHDLEGRWTTENFNALRAFCGMDTVAPQYIRLYTELMKEVHTR